MTCQECEIKLGMGEDAGEHVASCAECRLLARELRLNSYALREMRAVCAEAAGPGGPARTRASAPRFVAALAVAAVVVVAIGVWKIPKRAVITAAHGAAPLLQQPQQHKQRQAVPVKSVHKKRKPAPPMEPLRVKMFTSDPDVVIYWIVDKKEGYE